ncbi:hypothetical protein FGO68_gene17407 [Halteria grandinella]|uniref:Transmembrane protein n=1 Tax=Halteria grandinella TaxID=5974 RepID=A0A8J8NGK2_HALGN|nr:hypothetical protein FGO68_gene17407 [Halteria grandinella]
MVLQAKKIIYLEQLQSLEQQTISQVYYSRAEVFSPPLQYLLLLITLLIQVLFRNKHQGLIISEVHYFETISLYPNDEWDEKMVPPLNLNQQNDFFSQSYKIRNLLSCYFAKIDFSVKFLIDMLFLYIIYFLFTGEP